MQFHSPSLLQALPGVMVAPVPVVESLPAFESWPLWGGVITTGPGTVAGVLTGAAEVVVVVVVVVTTGATTAGVGGGVGVGVGVVVVGVAGSDPEDGLLKKTPPNTLPRPSRVPIRVGEHPEAPVVQPTRRLATSVE